MSKKSGRNAEFVKWFGPVIEALKALGGSAKPKEISEWIGENCQVPEEVLTARYEKSGQLRFANQIAWARQYLVWEELLDSSKHGVWSLTAKGWTTQLTEKDSKAIFQKWVKIFQELRGGKEVSTETFPSSEQVNDKIGDEEEQLIIQPNLLDLLKSVSPTGFEHLCARLLKEYNFEDIEVTQRSNDGGIDGYATLKLNPFVSLSVFFQCKRYQGTVPTEKVQAFIGVMETNKRSVEKGLMITTGTFAKSALEIEKGNIKLELVDGEKLVEMFEKVELGVKPKTVYEPDLKFFEPYREMK